MGRLILTVKKGEIIYIGDDITVNVHDIRGRTVKVCIIAPTSIPIARECLLKKEPSNKFRPVSRIGLTSLINRKKK